MQPWAAMRRGPRKSWGLQKDLGRQRPEEPPTLSPHAAGLEVSPAGLAVPAGRVLGAAQRLQGLPAGPASCPAPLTRPWVPVEATAEGPWARAGAWVPLLFGRQRPVSAPVAPRAQDPLGATLGAVVLCS